GARARAAFRRAHRPRADLAGAGRCPPATRARAAAATRAGGGRPAGPAGSSDPQRLLPHVLAGGRRALPGPLAALGPNALGGDRALAWPGVHHARAGDVARPRGDGALT